MEDRPLHTTRFPYSVQGVNNFLMSGFIFWVTSKHEGRDYRLNQAELIQKRSQKNQQIRL